MYNVVCLIAVFYVNQGQLDYSYQMVPGIEIEQSKVDFGPGLAKLGADMSVNIEVQSINMNKCKYVDVKDGVAMVLSAPNAPKKQKGEKDE